MTGTYPPEARPLNRRMVWRLVFCACGWTPVRSWATAREREIAIEERAHAAHHAKWAEGQP